MDIREASNYVSSWLELGKRFENPPDVSLSLSSQTPEGKEYVNQRDIAIATAKQCYADGKAKMVHREKKEDLMVGKSTLESGHLTTRQHASLTWRIAGVSRETVHTLLHGHPHYNTDQQSQRYVEAKSTSVLMRSDLDKNQREIYQLASGLAFGAYEEFNQSLRRELAKRVLDSVPTGWHKDMDKIDTKVKKHAQEIARYFLPIGQTTTLFYTLDVMTLMRMFTVGNMPHVTDEGRYLLASMANEAAKYDSSLAEDLFPPIDYENKETSFKENLERNNNFDRLLGQWQNSRMLTSESEIIKMMNNSLGFWSDSVDAKAARTHLLDPAARSNLATNLRPDWHDPEGSKLNEVSIRFMDRLSHTADSQRQRHRTTVSAVEPIEAHYSGVADFAIPKVVRETPLLRERYEEIMTVQYQFVERAIESGIPRETALLLIPNAQNIRLVENCSLLGLQHRTAQRLCHLAQEEVSNLAFEQAIQLNAALSDENDYFHAPCAIRRSAGKTPFCPEGARFCGIRVWSQDLENYWDERQY